MIVAKEENCKAVVSEISGSIWKKCVVQVVGKSELRGIYSNGMTLHGRKKRINRPV